MTNLKNRLIFICLLVFLTFSLKAVAGIDCCQRMKVIVSRDNSNDFEFSKEELQSLFVDVHGRWPNGMRVLVVTFPTSAMNARVFYTDYFSRVPEYGVEWLEVDFDRIRFVRSYEEMIRTVANDAGAIGYLPSDLVIFVEDNIQYLNYVETR